MKYMHPQKYKGLKFDTPNNQAITKEYVINRERVSKVVYYISKINVLSQHNFAKYSKSRIEKKNSYMYELDLEHPFILKMINRCNIDI